MHRERYLRRDKRAYISEDGLKKRKRNETENVETNDLNGSSK